MPLTENLIVHRINGFPNGGRLENPAITIVDNNNIVAGWQDDLSNVGAGWILLNQQGNILTKNIQSFIKPDKNTPSLNGMFFPILKANLFSSGFLFGATYFDWQGNLHPANRLSPWDSFFGSENRPVIQRLQSDGNYEGTMFLGVPPDIAMKKGSIRLADIEILSNGNSIMVAEAAQENDGPHVFGMNWAKKKVLASLFDSQGCLLRGPVSLLQNPSSQTDGRIWHGAAAGKDHFGVRYHTDSPKIRFFKNDLTPLTDEIPLQNELNSGGRGEDTGWHGNGKDKYLLVTIRDNRIYAAVFDEKGRPAFKTVDIDSNPNTGGFFNERCDGAIDEQGNFVTVGSYSSSAETNRVVIAARFFNSDGTPKTPLFYLTAVKPEDWVSTDIRPRITLRNGLMAVVWLDKNTNLSGAYELAIRLFHSPFK